VPAGAETIEVTHPIATGVVRGKNGSTGYPFTGQALEQMWDSMGLSEKT